MKCLNQRFYILIRPGFRVVCQFSVRRADFGVADTFMIKFEIYELQRADRYRNNIILGSVNGKF